VHAVDAERLSDLPHVRQDDGEETDSVEEGLRRLNTMAELRMRAEARM
jgi:hypothetical protein